MTYKAHVRNGCVVLDEPWELAEGVEVEVVLSAGGSAAPVTNARTLRDRLKPFIGMANGLPPDGSRNLDQHLYGAPKT